MVCCSCLVNSFTMIEYEKELEKAENELAVVEVELQELLEQKSSLLEKISELKAIITQQEESQLQRDVSNWDGTDFPWTQKLDQILRKEFKLSSLRPMQRQTMNATLSKEDCLLIMPTGGGKSLCFQLPALVDKGLTLVVSPLVSLMEDQQIALELLGISSAMLNAATTKERLKYVQDDMVKPNGQLKMLYVTPEKLAKSKRFMNRLEKCYAVGHLARIVIDEVHCCSQWGHDFRPDYKFLGIMKRQFPGTPILGLTATATTKVLEDVKKILSIPKALLFKASFNRPNLYFEVCEKPSSQKEVMDVIHRLISQRFSAQSGIVYCFSRKDSEEVTTDLQSRGIKAGCYHADVSAASRSTVHRKWLSGDIQVVVATVAFGMGIDKPDVRFVIHHSLSKSMENLYQESGRAGRDQKKSDCIILYRLADVARQSSMVFTEMTGLQNLHGIVKYCIDAGSCRRSLIARHFGEVWDVTHCNSMCDHCDKSRNPGSVQQKDVTKYCGEVLSILKAAADTEQRVTSAKLTEAWFGRGHSGLRVKSVAAPAFSKETAERILAHMLIGGLLQEDFHFTAYSTICYLVPGPKAKLLQNNGMKVFMDCRSKSSATSHIPPPKSGSKEATSASSLKASAKSTKTASSSFLKNEASLSTSLKKSKPKLVIVNKKFNNPDSPLGPSTANEPTGTLSSSAARKSQSFSNENPKIDKIKVQETNTTETFDDDDDFNFDDSDEGNFKQRPKRARITKDKPKGNISVTEEDFCPERGNKSLNGRKKKLPVDEDFHLNNRDQKKKKAKFFLDSDSSTVDSDSSTVDSDSSIVDCDSSIVAKDKKHSTSIVISDEDDDEKT